MVRKGDKIYVNGVEMTAASEAIAGKYTNNAPTRAEIRPAPASTLTTSGRQTGVGAGQTAVQPTQTWDEVASKYIPDQFKGKPMVRKGGKVYVNGVEMTAASQETSQYADNAPTRAQMRESVEFSPISEQYYNVLKKCLKENDAGINRDAYSKRGGGPKAVRAAKESLKSGGWSGDSNTVEDLPRERMSRKGGVDPDWFTKKAIIKFMGDAVAAGKQPTHQEMIRMANAALELHRKDPSQFREFLPEPGEKRPQFNLNPQKDLAKKLAKN
jgi:hypothetical protein